ncbi:hypothetical protein SD81_017015 [Tolypothrix campylonemoides VB511288]|nr:hypothetical protein SD81_017015 [Tolypothrix campylonemoides VB511288]
MKKRHSDRLRRLLRSIARMALARKCDRMNGVAQTLKSVGAACPQDLRHWHMKRSHDCTAKSAIAFYTVTNTNFL